MAEVLILLFTNDADSDENRRKRRAPRQFKDRRNFFDNIPQQLLRNNFRLTQDLILKLCDELKPQLQHTTFRNKALSVETQVLVALRFYASGSFQNVIGDMFGLSQPTVSHVIKTVTNALCMRVNSYITFPTSVRELVKTKQTFFHSSGFPNVVGVIDGTHIYIKAPNDHENVYINRKKQHSINVQCVCNEDLVLTNVVARWPGSTHDSFIFDHSNLAELFRSQDAPDGWLIGDKGYSQLPFLMTPVRQPQNIAEERYNLSHRRARNIIERCFGILKSRFRCLDKSGGVLCYPPERCCKIIVACCILHNICVKFGLSFEEEIILDEYGDEREVQEYHDSQGVRERSRIIQAYFS